MSDDTKMLRVVLAEDNYLVREGTRQLIELGGEVEVVGSAGTLDELMAAAEESHPDVVVTDIRMPPSHHLEGIEGAHALRQRYPKIGVVILSNHSDYGYALELFKDGTQGLAYLLKDRVGDRAELLRAIRETARGGSVIDPIVVEALVGRSERKGRNGIDELTPRERQVLESMAAGRTNGAIAEELHLSVSGVEKNVNAIFTKLGLSEERSTHRRVAAVLAYLSSGQGEHLG